MPKILYIDDTPSARMLVRRLLSSRYDLSEADDGLAGIEQARKIHPDLVLVDLHMPHLNGYEVATRIKSLMPDVPIVALTADVTAHVRERVLASGCDGYLSKPIDPDTFVEQVQAFLGGEREELKDEGFRREYQQRLVARLEEKVRELSQTLQQNDLLNKQNLELLRKAQRRARLLETGARVSRTITSILDMDVLLRTIVDTICDEFGFYFASVFLLDEAKEWAVLRAGRGEAGEKLFAEQYRLQVGGHSLIGTVTERGRAHVASDVEKESEFVANPYLPHTRSEIVLPLQVGKNMIGVLDVQSTEVNAFAEDDVTALQILADQLAVAINNAYTLDSLEEAHQELVRVKTYEAIAAATGEAIHWVGNKAAPIPGSVKRIGQDLARYLSMAIGLLPFAPADHKFVQLLSLAAGQLEAQGVDLDALEAELEARPLRRLQRMLSVESIFEDLQIVENSGQAILNIKEDLIGPARKKRVETVSVPDLLTETVNSMGIKDDVAHLLFVGAGLKVRADRAQLGRVFTNLIKNAMEAMHRVGDKKLVLWARLSDDGEFVVVDVTDNGEGIPPDQMEKVWMPFHTTKGDRGGTGLGLPACAQIIGELGGKIVVESDLGLGTTFSVFVPSTEPQG